MHQRAIFGTFFNFKTIQGFYDLIHGVFGENTKRIIKERFGESKTSDFNVKEELGLGFYSMVNKVLFGEDEVMFEGKPLP